MKSWKIGRNVGRSEIWLSRGAAWYGGGGFLSEAGLRERAQAHGRVFGAGREGVRIWAFWLWDFGISRNMQLNKKRYITRCTWFCVFHVFQKNNYVFHILSCFYVFQVVTVI